MHPEVSADGHRIFSNLSPRAQPSELNFQAKTFPLTYSPTKLIQYGSNTRRHTRQRYRLEELDEAWLASPKEPLSLVWAWNKKEQLL